MDGGDVCVTLGTKIKWFTSDTDSKFTVNFAQNPFAHPATPASFSGTDGDAPKGGKASHLPPNPPNPPNPTDACYQYSVTYSVKGSPNAVLDPKVIVKGVQFMSDAKGYSEPPPNK